MKKFTVKSVTSLFLVTGIVTSGVYGISKIDNKDLSYEVNSKEALKYNQNNIVESNNLEGEIENNITKTKAAEEKVETAIQEYEKAVNAKKVCEEELKNATNAEDKAKVEEKLKVLEEKVKKTETIKKEAEKTLEEVKNVEEPKKEAIENNSKTSNSTTTLETTSQNTSDLEIVKNAVDKTINAKNMTVNNNVENSTRKFDKTIGNEYAEYRKSFSITETSGTLYSYKINSKTISLFKDNGSSEWKMVFSGKRSLGVIELELLKDIKSVEKNDDVYNVTISHKNAKTWLSTYYGKSLSKTNDITIAVKINNGYVQSIKGNVDIEIDLELNNINSTSIPTRESIGIDDNTIKALEAEYQAKKDCERENDYWVCGPHKHVNQYNF